MAKGDINKRLFDEAKRFIPGGVNSPVRSFSAVGGEPIFIKRAKGSRIYGEDGRQFIDYCMSWGALILGHSHPEVIRELKKRLDNGTSFGAPTLLETELATLINEAMPSLEQVRLTNSGTEAVMGALRLARAYTGKNKIIKFEGSYHGHADYLLVKAGSGAATFGIPLSLGVPEDFTKHTIALPFNDIDKVESAVNKYRNELAAIIVEPVPANCGVILPKPDFLQALRAITHKYGVILVFDEVITGFRLSYGGAQKHFDIKPDLTCLGKIIGGGLPVGAFGGKKEIMGLLSPLGGAYQAGTLSGNPIAVTAGIVTLKTLKRSSPYAELERKTKRLCEGIRLNARKHGIKINLNYISSLFSIYMDSFREFFHGLLNEGIYFSPSGFEADFLSVAHTGSDIEKTLEAVGRVFKNIRRK